LQVNEGWQNRWGMMRLADFSVGKSLKEVNPSDLPTESSRSAAAFREALAEFRRMLQHDDVLYFYDSDPEEWDRGFGSTGYAIVRDGELLETLVVQMN
jgi:hypothetical protein